MAATSSVPAVFLTQRGSVLDLFQRLRTEGRISFGENKGTRRFAIKIDEKKVVPNPDFVHTGLYKVVVKQRLTLGPVPSATPQTHDFIPTTDDYVPVEFDTLVLVWYMITCTDTLEDVDKAIEYTGITYKDLDAVDVIEFFDLKKNYEDEKWPLTIHDLFSIVLNSFFITRRPPRFVNLLFVHICSPIVGEYEQAKEEPLLTDKRCYTVNGQGYMMTLYGAFVTEYMQWFMAHYGGIWSINQGRHV